MAFFKTKPNVQDAEKARIEFHLQQVVECVGYDRFKLPVLNLKKMQELAEAGHAPREIVGFVGKHLSHDVTELRVDETPEQLEKCGSGG